MTLGRKKQRVVWRDQLRAFGDSLDEALRSRAMSHAELAGELGVAKATVFTWRTGVAEAPYDLVFEMEHIMALPPGQLSRHLGYLPVDADSSSDARSPSDTDSPSEDGDAGRLVGDPLGAIEKAVAADALLSPEDKQTLLALYRKLIWKR